MFRTIKSILIALFDERYAVFANIVAVVATTAVAATTPSREMEMPYREFNNT